MPPHDGAFTIGELAARSGAATSALRFYETRGLIRAERTAGGQRRYTRETLRRVAFIRAGQRVGLSLATIGTALAELPDGRTPTKADWGRLSRSWQAHLDAKRAELDALQDKLTGCIGCGCLSLRSCALFNGGDQAAARGAGARYLLGDTPPLQRPRRSVRAAVPANR
ncbi:MAG TPA: redox-sensitive transcriptional activator SoxR [Candidatus Limnocylindria bacterium]